MRGDLGRQREIVGKLRIQIRHGDQRSRGGYGPYGDRQRGVCFRCGSSEHFATLSDREATAGSATSSTVEWESRDLPHGEAKGGIEETLVGR